MWKYLLLGSGALALILIGISLIDLGNSGDVRTAVALMGGETDFSGYARAIEPYSWQFPRDHGPHPAFQTEWWYYTGNLADESGRRFGYQFTVFRRAIAPTEAASPSEWRTNQVYMAHFTLTDVAGGRFYQQQRFSRGGADLAGATADPRYHVWLEDWQATALNDDGTRTAITASGDGVAIALLLEQIKPPALQGDHGLSQKSSARGNASYYYALTRLLTEGTVTVDGRIYTVSGATWMDHEFSTSALGPDAQGWDWFGLHLDGDRELMLGRIRLADGGYEPVFGGLFVFANGRTRRLDATDFTITETATWTSPHTGAIYPAGWEISVDVGDSEPLDLVLTPLLADQELTEGIAYWEGAVRITGDAAGYGYVELTGYAGSMNGRF